MTSINVRYNQIIADPFMNLVQKKKEKGGKRKEKKNRSKKECIDDISAVTGELNQCTIIKLYNDGNGYIVVCVWN